MGWTGIYVDRRPSFQEMTRMVDEWTRGDRYRNIDRSGWMGHGSHIYLLTEHDGEDGSNVRFITVVLVEYVKGELRYKVVDESVGPYEVDCPMRLINALEGHPPVNDYALKWRERVTEFHNQTRPKNAILRTLRREYPDGERRLALTTGETVTYDQGNYRKKKNVSAYWRPGEGLILLKPAIIDAPATYALWAPADADDAAAEATATDEATVDGPTPGDQPTEETGYEEAGPAENTPGQIPLFVGV